MRKLFLSILLSASVVIGIAQTVYYTVENEKTGKLLRALGNNSGSDIKADGEDNTSDYQLWTLVNADNDEYYIQNKASGLNLRAGTNQYADAELSSVTNNTARWTVPTVGSYGQINHAGSSYSLESWNAEGDEININAYWSSNSYNWKLEEVSDTGNFTGSVAPSGKNYVPVFQDDFNGSSLDRTKWDSYYSWGGTVVSRTHNYDAYCVDDYAIVSNGTLKLKVTENSEDPYDHDKTYTNGVITSGNHYMFKHGYVEGRFKIPHGYRDAYNGLWPAFWTTSGVNWPINGEIDIFEYFGNNQEWATTIHHKGGYGETAPSLSQNTTDASVNFHVYGVEWETGVAHFYLDGVYLNSISFVDFDVMHEILINFGIHGPNDNMDWLGDASPNTFPLYFECDWIRVWQVDTNKSNEVVTSQSYFEDEGAEFIIYPNPTFEDGTIYISTTGTELNDNVSLSITDLNGRLVYTKNISSSENEQKLKIDKVLPQGIYSINLVSNNFSKQEMLIVK